jgi:hypothetical protein
MGGPLTDIFSCRYAISRYDYAVASRSVVSAALYGAIDAVETNCSHMRRSHAPRASC